MTQLKFMQVFLTHLLYLVLILSLQLTKTFCSGMILTKNILTTAPKYSTLDWFKTITSYQLSVLQISLLLKMCFSLALITPNQQMNLRTSSPMETRVKSLTALLVQMHF
jgi:hypothetical protein